jgi:hypothetical protein
VPPPIIIDSIDTYITPMPKCILCKQEKPESDFTKYELTKRSTMSRCKECRNSKAKQQRIDNPGENRERCRIYYKNNSEKWSSYSHKKALDPNWVPRKWARNSIQKHNSYGYQVNISIDELEQLALDTSECPICGVKFHWTYTKGNTGESPTLDRINNDHIMTIDKCMIMCARCNGIKGRRTLEEFLKYCNMIVNKFGDKK